MTAGQPATSRGNGRVPAVTIFPSHDTGARIARPRKSQEVTRDDMEIVSALCSALASQVGQERYELWFGRSVAFQVTGQIVHVAVAEAFRLEYVRRTFRTEIAACAAQVLGSQAAGGQPAIEFRLDPSAAGGPPLVDERKTSTQAPAIAEAPTALSGSDVHASPS